MKSDKRIGIAFVLNLAFALLEAAGGWLTGSVAVLSDAVHDLGDALGIGVSFLLERKSRRAPDGRYTYGYARYSVLSGIVTSLVLLCGASVCIVSSVHRLFHPAAIHYDGMLVLAVLGVLVNGVAAFVTRDGASLGQKAVNLHMLEDVLGWLAVLCGAVVMRFTDLVWIDPLLSIGVSVFITVHAVRHLREALVPLLERTPEETDVAALHTALAAVEGVESVHHLHVWTLDGRHHCATVHVVTSHADAALKSRVRALLHEHSIDHVTIEIDSPSEPCPCPVCAFPDDANHHHHHHH